MARGKREDLTGQRFGRLTVVNLNEEISKQKGRLYWNCKCDCGNEKVVYRGHLKSGRTSSCGCYQKEKAKEMWQDEEFRQKQIDKTREKWEDEEFRQMKSIKTKEQWQDEDMKWKMGYKGGITSISGHLKNLIEQWYSDCKQQANYTCELTGKVGRVNTHHLKAFSVIVLEAHKLHNIQVKSQVKDYTKEELHKLEEYVASWHKDNSNAVVLNEEVHILFHKKYGYGDNTPEQFKEFRERYIAGEFEGLI